MVKKALKICFSLFFVLFAGCDKYVTPIDDIPFIENENEEEKIPEVNPDNKIRYPSKVYHVYTKKEFDDVLKEIKSSGLKLYKMGIFTASWCAPCKEIKAEVSSWPSAYNYNIAFIYIHMDDSSYIKNIKSIPQIKFRDKAFIGSTDITNGELKKLMMEVQ